MSDCLGDRMKAYENVERRYFMRRQPLIVRLDGVHFHSYTKGFPKPYYSTFRRIMEWTMKDLCKEIEGCKLGYTQSDEITLLLTDDDTIKTQAWYGKNLQKIVSVSASLATYYFNKHVDRVTTSLVYFAWDIESLVKAKDRVACFDSRAFCVPREEVLNVFEWRQQDCTRNAIEAAGQAYFSHKELSGKSCNEIQEMLYQKKGINFNDYPTWYKRGVCCIKRPTAVDDRKGGCLVRNKWDIDHDTPIFHQKPEYINKLLYKEE